MFYIVKGACFPRLILVCSLLALLAGCASEVKSDEPLLTDITPPQVEEFVLGSGDSMEIVFYRIDDLKRTVKIDNSGKVMLPLIGDVVASGKGIFAFRDELRAAYSRYIVDPQITITVTNVQSQKALVLGEVNSPGVFIVDSTLSVSDALAKAGGITTNGDPQSIIVVEKISQGKATTSVYDYDAVIKRGDLSKDKIVKSGYIVYVPKRGIASVAWYMTNISAILSPIIGAETGIVLWPQMMDALNGKGSSTSVSVSNQ